MSRPYCVANSSYSPRGWSKRRQCTACPAATAAAWSSTKRFIAATGDTASVVVDDDSAADADSRPQARSHQPSAEPAVTVKVTRTVATQFLQWVGIKSFTVTETATSNAVVTGSTS